MSNLPPPSGTRRSAPRKGVFDYHIPKTSIPWAVIPILVGAVLAAAIWSRVKSSTDDSNGGGCVKVQYIASGSAGMNLTMTSPSGTVQRSTGTSSTQDYCVDVGAFVYLSAQLDADSGQVRCTIRADGLKISDNTSTGAYSIASCSGKAERA